MRKRLTLITNAHSQLGWLEFTVVNLLYQIGVTRWNPRKNYLTQTEYNQVSTQVQLGDIVLVGQYRRLSSLFIRGVFTHSLVYVGDGTCVHAYAKGVEKIKFIDLFSEYDTMAIVRVPGLNTIQQEVITTFLERRLGEPYDFWFEAKDPQAWFCSELTCAAFIAADIRLDACAALAALPSPNNLYHGALEVVFTSSRVVESDKQLTLKKS